MLCSLFLCVGVSHGMMNPVGNGGNNNVIANDQYGDQFAPHLDDDTKRDVVRALRALDRGNTFRYFAVLNSVSEETKNIITHFVRNGY